MTILGVASAQSCIDSQRDEASENAEAKSMAALLTTFAHGDKRSGLGEAAAAAAAMADRTCLMSGGVGGMSI